MSQTAIEALRAALHDPVIEIVRMSDTGERDRQKAVDTITAAALSTLHAKAGVSVKGLEWETVEEEVHYVAKSILGTYVAMKDEWWMRESSNYANGSFKGVEAAKAAAQADYNARILSALSTTLQEPVGETQATVYDWEFTNPETGKWDYARTPEKAQKLIEDGIKVTPVYTIEQVTQTATTTLAHQPVTAGWEKKSKGNAKIYTHLQVDHAIVENHYGICFNGYWYSSVQEAKDAALKSEGRNDG